MAWRAFLWDCLLDNALVAPMCLIHATHIDHGPRRSAMAASGACWQGLCRSRRGGANLGDGPFKACVFWRQAVPLA